MSEPFSITGFNNFNNKWLPSQETDIEIGHFYYKLLPFFSYFSPAFNFLSALHPFASLHHCDNFFKQFDANYLFLCLVFLFFFPFSIFHSFNRQLTAMSFRKGSRLMTWERRTQNIELRFLSF